MDATQPISLPSAIQNQVLDELEYEPGDTIKGIAVDLNRDTRLDYIIRSASTLCGNGGCSYLIVDGRSQSIVGRVFGEPLYFHQYATGGYPELSAYSHVSAVSGSYTVWTFQNGRYRQASARSLEVPALDSLIQSLKRIPLWHGANTNKL
jgi:hypothetical protein